MIEKEDWVAWKTHPITKTFLENISKTRQELMEDIAEGAAVEDELQRTIGRCMSLKDVVSYALYDFFTQGETEKDET